MEKIVPITYEESSNVENLFNTYNSYMAMLEYFANTKSNTEMYEKKWDEAVQLHTKLDKAKRDIEKKYKPLGEWKSFEFDFENSQVIFIK